MKSNKKNVIMITIDAFCFEYLGKKENKNSSTPFLDFLINDKNVTSISKMYSEAPYTEAALMSLLGGVDSASNGSYMKRLYKTNCIFKEFKKNGYTTFANCLQSGIYPSGALPGIDYLYYNTGFDFKGCWNYRLKYYKDKYLNNQISKDEKRLITDILNDNFEEAIKFLSYLKTKNNNVELIYNKLDVSKVENNINLVNEEFSKYKEDSEKYLKELFILGEDHPILKLNSYPLDKKLDESILKEYEKKYMPIVKKVYLKNLIYNFKNNGISIKKLKFLFKTNKKFALSYLKSYASAIIDADLKDRVRANKCESMKTIASARKSIEHFEKWCLSNINFPFFAYLHFDDIHFREMFFTHDTSDFKVLDEEFELVKKYIKNLPKNYKGSLCYDLSVQYVDNQIKRLFSFLKQYNLLDNTDIIITADHGNSYTYQVPRESYVINFYEENYHVPCIIYSKTKKININQNNFYQTKDIPATILDLNDIKIPVNYEGKSMVDFMGREYALIEYCGSGCPNIIDRPIFLGVKTKNYKVAGEVLLCDGKFNIKEVYDLKHDYYENINLINSINYDNLIKELQIINNEIDKLKESNKKIIGEIK